LRKQIDGSLLRLAVDAHIGDGVEPNLCGRLDSAEVGQLEPMQEILFDVARIALRCLSPELLELLRDWYRIARPAVWLFPRT
jgi:hypothetical protein